MAVDLLLVVACLPDRQVVFEAVLTPHLGTVQRQQFATDQVPLLEHLDEVTVGLFDGTCVHGAEIADSPRGGL